MKRTQMRFQDIKRIANFITSSVSSSSKPSWHRHWNVPGVFKQSPCSPHKFGISSHSLVSWHVLWKKEIFRWVIFFAILFNYVFMVSPKRYLKSFTYCPCGREHILDYIHIELDLRNWYRLDHILRFLFCTHLQHEN